MKTLVIIPCGSSKVWDRYPLRGPVPAHSVYVSGLFKLGRQYAETFGDVWMILSAKYGFISPDFSIPGPYEVSFKHPASGPISIAELRRQAGEIKVQRVIGLGGREYREAISAAFATIEVNFPFAGLSLGHTMHAIKKALHDHHHSTATSKVGFWL